MSLECGAQPQQSRFRTWLLWRIVQPLAVMGVFAWITWGIPYEATQFWLLWILFPLHLLGIRKLGRSHVLDTGSFVFLMGTIAAVAAMSEPLERELELQALFGGAAYILYAACSYAGLHLSSPPLQATGTRPASQRNE